MVVKEDVKEALEIERSKMNLVIHGVPKKMQNRILIRSLRSLVRDCIWISIDTFRA